jgi:nicotinamidase-related amidase
LAVLPACSASEPGKTGSQTGRIEFAFRSRDAKTGEFKIRKEKIDPKKIGIMIVDMWASQGARYPDAVARLDYLAPVINQITAAARDRGTSVIHVTCGAYPNYTDTPMFRNVVALPGQTLPPANDYTIDDPSPADNSQVPPGIKLHAGHFSTDSISIHPDLALDPQYDLMTRAATGDWGYGGAGQQDLWNIIHQRGLTHLFYVGCHTNMCVIGRSFGIENILKTGADIKCVLLREPLEAYTVNGRDWENKEDPAWTPDTGNNYVLEQLEKHVLTAEFVPIVQGRDDSRYYCTVRDHQDLLCYWRMNGHTTATNPYWCILDHERVQSAWNGPSPEMQSVTLGVAGALMHDQDTAAQFDGSRAISVGPIYRDKLPPGSPLLCLSDESFSVEAWVRLDTVGSSPRWILTHDDGSHVDFLLGVTADAKFTFVTRDMKNRTISKTVVKKSDIDKNRWYHLVGVQDAASGDVCLYVNGVKESDVALKGAAVSTDSTLQIGSRGKTEVNPDGYLANCGFEIFTGAIDEVAIYQAALSGKTIQTHFRLGMSE